ncbi:MAG: LamG-like jellyroll fold domain-containing protein [Anaerohalosphaeraceae bacterium]
MWTKWKEGKISVLVIRILLVFVFIGSASAWADITYTLIDSGGWPADIRNQIESSIAEAVGLYNQHGSFNKQLYIRYSTWPGVTAEANFNGDLTFGSLRSSRVALHEMAHTMGCGTYWDWPNHMVGSWNGAYATAKIKEFDGGGALLYGDKWHFWPYGLNYDNEDSYTNRIRHIRLVAAMAGDMGFLSFIREPSSQVLQPGATAVFSVEAANTQSYAWYKQGNSNPLTNGGDISGATTNTLRIANVKTSDAGRYYCRISGELSSRPASLVVSKPVGHWKFTDNTLDKMGINHGTMAGSPGYTTGKIGRAIDLDGTDDFVTLPAGVADARDITNAVWVNWDGGNPWQRVFDFGNNTSQYLLLTPRSGDNTLRFSIKNGGGEQMVDAAQLSTGQWVHLAVTLNGDTATLYVNGAATASNSSVTINPFDFMPNKNYVGDSQYAADPLFNGRMDEFRIYSYALTSAEIQTLYAGVPKSPLPAANTANVPTQLCLTWDGGVSEENAWQVYVGTSLTAITNATPSSTEYYGIRYEQQFSTPMLLPNTFYYWRVDPLLPDGTVLKGRIWPFTTGSTTGQLTPKFVQYMITKPNAVEGVEYNQSLTGEVLTAGASNFQKLAGPDWIEISSDGRITGIPPEGAAGQTACTVQIADAAGRADEAVVSILVQDTCSGMKGLPDLTRFAEQWLYAGPVFSPSDLDQNQQVDLADWSYFAADWNYIADPGLVAAWTMDEAMGVTAGDELGQYPATLQNMNTLWRPVETIPGKTSHCLAFDGVDDYAVVSGFKGIGGAQSRTCMAWIKTSSSGAEQTILSWGSASAGTKWIFRIQPTGELAVVVWGGNFKTVTTLNDGRWHHVAAVLPDSAAPNVTQIKLYVDGQLQTNAFSNSTQTINTGLTEDVQIGSFFNGSQVSFFKGLIDDVRIYNRALSGDEIACLAQASTVAYWRFEEGPLYAPVLHGAAGNGVFYPGALDSSGNGNHLSVFAEGWAGYGYRNDVANSVFSETGVANKFSVQNTGPNPAMSTGSEAMRTMTPKAFTIEVSFKPESGGFRTLIGRDSYGAIAETPAMPALNLQITPSNAVAIKFADVAGKWHTAQSADGLIQGFTFPNAAQGHWYHAVAVSDGTFLSLYLADVDAGRGYELVAQTDMTLSGSTNTALTAGLGSGSDWQAGTWSVGRGLSNGGHADRAYGFIDEVRISSKALMPSQFLYAKP